MLAEDECDSVLPILPPPSSMPNPPQDQCGSLVGTGDADGSGVLEVNEKRLVQSLVLILKLVSLLSLVLLTYRLVFCVGGTCR